MANSSSALARMRADRTARNRSGDDMCPPVEPRRFYHRDANPGGGGDARWERARPRIDISRLVRCSQEHRHLATGWRTLSRMAVAPRSQEVGHGHSKEG